MKNGIEGITWDASDYYICIILLHTNAFSFNNEAITSFHLLECHTLLSPIFNVGKT